MSAKCDYSAKFKPLVLAKRSQLNEDAFRAWAYETFANPDFAISVTNAGSQFLSDLDINKRSINDAPQQIDSIKSYFVNKSSEYNKCIKEFTDTVIESALYNYHTNEWIDSEEMISEISRLNRNLFQYKIDLVNRIFMGNRAELSIDPTEENADAILTKAIQDAIDFVDSTTSPEPNVYSAYVILKNFNKLISEKTPFIQLRSEYEHTNSHGVNMYIYTGPNVKHRTSWTTNELVSADGQYSDLAKALLNYLPERSTTDGRGERIPNTSIGVDGFVSVMNHFKSALIYSDALSKHRTDYYEGRFNIKEALEDYYRYIRRMSSMLTSLDKDYFTTQLTKLRAIIDYVFDSKLDNDVKDMFKAMFNKTEPLTYMTYMWRNGKFAGVNLKDSFVNTQMLNMQDTVNGRVLQFRVNPNQFQKLQEKWNFTINLNDQTIEFNSPTNDFVLKLQYSFGQGNYQEFTTDVVSGVVNDSVLGNFIADLLGVFLPTDNYTDLSRMINKNGSLLNDFKDIIAMTLLASDKRVTGANFSPLDPTKNRINFKTLFLFNNFNPVGKTLSILYGTETRNVVNDINGHKLPTNGLTSLIFKSAKLAAEMTRSDSQNYINPFASDFLAPKYNPNTDSYGTPGFLAPIIRQGVRIAGKTKSVSQLNLAELLEISQMYDFLDNLNLAGNSADVIYLQNTNVADKERHLIIPYLTRKIVLDGKEYNMGSLINRVAKGLESSDRLFDVWRTLRKNRYDAISKNIISDYNTVFKYENFKSLEDVDKFLLSKNYSVDQLRKLFRKSGVNFKEEVHASEINKVARVNEVLFNYVKTFNDEYLAKRRLQKSRAYFANDMFKCRLKINRYTNQAIDRAWDYIPKEWKETIDGSINGQETGNLILFKVFDKNGKQIKVSAANPDAITNPENTVVLNPISEAYLMSDIIYSNEYNQLHVGDVFCHATKNKNGSTEVNGWGSTDFYDISEASRLVAQNKRAVIYGGSVHAFQHDLADNRGVSKRIKVAVVKDIKASVWNMVGGLEDKSIDDEIDSMDGSGLQSIYEAILEQESLKDAAAGFDEKTILGWNDKYFGRQILLKWAVYALTNERRRKSRLSEASGELLFKKMHSQKFNKNLNMYDIWRQNVDKDLYFKDFNTRKYYKILGVTHNAELNVYARIAIEVDENGNPILGTKQVFLDNRNRIVEKITNPADFTYNTLYDLDQFFGGADEMSLVNGVLTYTNRGNYIVTNIICKENLKDYFIAYTVNKSAVKVGVENLNDSEIFTDPNLDLDTMEMSTEYGGLQMNAEHELEDSEVSEMTQMISALIEKGYSFDLVNQIYQDIGAVVIESMRDIKKAIATFDGDPNKLKTLFGKALIEAYAKGDRDTLGLAQSFLAKAERMLRENDVRFTFPFSGATINPSFIATVSSILTKRGIRRKYSGVAAVLTPSYNMMQIYGDGKTLEAYADELLEWKQKPENFLYANVPIESLIKDVQVQTALGLKLNPFIKEDTLNEFDFEDTIIVEENEKDPETGLTVTKLSKPIVIDSLTKYDYYKHFIGKRYIFTSRPRNLKGSNTKFKLVSENGSKGIERSVYDTTAVRAANFSRKKVWEATESTIIFDVLKQAVSIYQEEIVWNDDFDEPGELLNQLAKCILNKDRTGTENIINVRRTLYNIVQRQMADLVDNGFLNDVYLTKGVHQKVTDVNVEGAEIILGKLFAKQFNLIAGDDVSDILRRGPDFFYERISGNYRFPTDINPDQYDAIAYTQNGESILVKIDSNLEYPYDKTANPNITKVDGKAYINSEEFTESEDKEFYQINGENGNKYNVVVVKDTDAYLDLISSKQITVHKLNYNLNNYEKVLQIALDLNDDLTFTINDNGKKLNITYGEVKDRGWSDEKILALLRQAEADEFEKRLRQKSTNMFDAFKLSLNFVGARIPSQAMQSFQPLKIIAFTDSETNDVYVNRHQTYLEGSDYDIDKSYILGYEVSEDGTIDAGTRLTRYIGLEKSFELTIPKGRSFEEGENGLLITRKDLTMLLKNTADVELWNRILNANTTTLTFEDPILLEGNENPELLAVENQKRIDRHDKAKKRLLFMLNLHEHSNVSETALKNRVVHGIRKVVLNPKNQLNLLSPISMDTQRDMADRSDLGKSEHNISIDVPSSKYMMQEQNMVGKQCIGITAVATKTFFAKSTYYNQLLQQIPGLVASENDAEVLKILESLVFVNPITGKLSLLANVNLRDVIKKLPRTTLNINTTGQLKKWNPKNGVFNLLDCLKYLKRQSDRVDCAMELSGLLSAATDNAKELILSKINATSKFIDIYTVALQCGSTFEEISTIMMSPIFNAISRLTDNNIFKTFEGSYRLEKAIDFYLDTGLLPGVKKEQLKNLLRKDVGLTKSDIFTDQILFDKLKDNRFIESILPNVYGLVKNANKTNYNDEGYDLDESSTEKPSRADYLAIANFLEECIDRNETKARLYKQYPETANKQIQNLWKIKTIFIPATEEQNILGQMLGINQGLKTSGYKQYSLIFNIENFINKRLGLDKNNNGFSLLKFISDPIYKQQFINKYEEYKRNTSASFINILDVISKVPHFAEMFNSLYDNHFILSNLSAKYQLTQSLANQISGEYPLTEKEFRQVGYYINDLFIVSFLTSRGLSIQIPKDVPYYPKTRGGKQETAKKLESVSLDSLYGLASFKSWVENYVIPTLQSNERLRKNSFVSSLSRSSNDNKITGEQQSYYKLPLNMLTIDQNTTDKSIYESILSGFNNIANDRFEGGMKIADIFFIYNCIVNKDSFGQTSMTRLFEDLVDSKTGSTLVSDYYEFISKIDDTPELRQEFEKSINVDDAKFYIKSYVPGTYITSPTIWSYNYDFTFRMPSLFGNWLANKPNVDPYVDNITSYSYQLSGRDVLESLAESLANRYGKDKIQVHSQEWFNNTFPDDERARTNPAFIDNGVIYINSDLAKISDVLHEYSHLILAALKYNPATADIYYKLVGSIREHPNYNILAEDYRKYNLVGTDLDEEVFVRVLQNYFDNKINNWSGNNVLESEKGSIIEAITEVLGTNLDKNVDVIDLMSSTPGAVIKKFGSNLFNFDLDFDLAQEAIVWRATMQAQRKLFIKEEQVKVKC